MATPPIRVTVWHENIHDRKDERVRAIYPQGMHSAIADALTTLLGDRVVVRTATLDQPDQGLPDSLLAETDVLTWWGHVGHDQVEDALVAKVQQRVLDGMGLLVLHSGHYSKIFRKLMGTSCALRWREDPEEREIVWTVRPGHPITAGVPPVFVIPHQEMYGEYFDIPAPDELIFLSTFTGGEVFRSGCCFQRGQGKVFYFSPGHETFPVYHQPEIQRIIANAVEWVYQEPSVQAAYRVTGLPHSPTGWFEQ